MSTKTKLFSLFRLLLLLAAMVFTGLTMFPSNPILANSDLPVESGGCGAGGCGCNGGPVDCCELPNGSICRLDRNVH